MNDVIMTTVFSLVTQQPPHGRPAPQPNINHPRPQNRGNNGAFNPPGRGRPSYPAPAAPRQPPPSGFGRGGEFFR